MIILQEETSPVDDLFFGTKLYNAMQLIENIATSNSVDTDLLKEACKQTEVIMKDFIKKIDSLEIKLSKESKKDKVLSMINKGFEND